MYTYEKPFVQVIREAQKQLPGNDPLRIQAFYDDSKRETVGSLTITAEHSDFYPEGYVLRIEFRHTYQDKKYPNETWADPTNSLEIARAIGQSEMTSLWRQRS